MDNTNSHADVWWNIISGPNYVIETITCTLCDKQGVIIKGKNIPYEREMRNIIQSRLQEKNIYTEIIDNSEIKDINFGEYLLEKFGSSSDRRYYRRGIGTAENYIHEKNILKNKLIWFINVPENYLNECINFYKEYNAKNYEDGLLLFEFNDNKIENIKGLQIINIDQLITFYDILSFAMMLTSKFSVNETLKHYFVWIVTLLFKNDITSLVRFLNEEISSGDISEVIVAIEKLNSGKLNIDTNILNNSFWKAQLQIIFPIIEELRTGIIKKHYNLIEDALSKSKGQASYFGGTIKNPYDSEYGFLVYLMNQKSSNGEYLLSFPSNIYKEIYFLHKCRNKLAHLDYCDIEEIKKIISLQDII
jgi:hypothetical protein